MIRKIKSFAKNLVSRVQNAFAVKEARLTASVRSVLAGTAAEGYVDTGVKIIIAVVIGALLLAGLYALFNSTFMPTVTQKVQGLFNYNGH